MKKKIYSSFIAIFLFFLVSNVISQTVYITKTGKKYHAETCTYLSKSKIPITLADAQAKGYQPCKVCNPGSTPSGNNKETTTPNSNTSSKKENVIIKDSRKAAKVQCSATTKKGERCKRMTDSPNGKCYQHGGN